MEITLFCNFDAIISFASIYQSDHYSRSMVLMSELPRANLGLGGILKRDASSSREE